MPGFGSLAPDMVDPLTGAPFENSPAAQAKFGRISDALLAGLRNMVETPGRAMREGITTDQAVDWAAPTALGMVGAPGVPAGAVGSSARIARAAADTLPMDEASRMARAAEQGYTLDAYHGTRAPEFDAFKRKQNDLGVHFGTADQAGDRLSYLGDRKGLEGGERILPVKLDIQNPLRMDDIGAWNSENVAYALRSKHGFDQNDIRLALNKGNESGRIAALRDLIERRGYDGVVYKNTGETGGAEPMRRAAHSAYDEMQQAMGPKKYSFSVEDQAHPAYQKWRAADAAYEAFRKENAQDSYIAFRPSQARSKFAAFDPANEGNNMLLGSLAGLATPTVAGGFGSLVPRQE